MCGNCCDASKPYEPKLTSGVELEQMQYDDGEWSRTLVPMLVEEPRRPLPKSSRKSRAW